MPIKLLSDELINKIAAGEVIERPFSVVKELLENCIDARAENITIELKEGGKSLIKVTDDGIGMDEKDALACFLRHSTSKIGKEEDLFNITSLGFRGEALASIAAVSNLKIITKQKDSLEATKLLIQAGQLLKSEKTGSPDGTAIEVSDLFFNTPARRKYLNVITTELNHIIDIATRYMLAYPNIGFKLIHNGNPVLSSPKTDSLGNIVNVYGKETAKQMITVEHEDKDVKVAGFISKPSLTRADKSHQSIFINGRYVKNKIITNAIYDAYHTLLFNKRHPVAVLHVEIQPKEIDVNVHPQKTEIRIQHESLFYNSVFEAVKNALQENDLIPQVSAEEQKPLLEREQTKKEVKKQFIEPSKQTELDVEINIKEKEDDERVDIRVLGQVHKSFIIAEDPDGLLIIDQHAAEERYNYEKFMEQFFDNDVKVQELVSPINLDFSLADFNLIKQNLKLITKLGFNVEEFGQNSFLLRTIPVIFHKQQGKDLLLDVLDEIKNQKNKIENIKEKILIRMACRASIKAGDSMEHKEMHDLIKRLFSTKLPYTCPHGRPVALSFTKDQLEKMFKRKG